MKILKTVLAILFAALILWPTGIRAQGPISGPTMGKLAVTPAGYDDMKSVLDSMGFSPEEIAWEDLSNLEKLKQYSAVYINCSGSTDGVAEQAAPAIKQYVADGGVIYASDFADSIIAKAFPGKISFYGGSEGLGARAGSAGKVTAKVKDAGMAAVLGKSEIEVNFDLPSWVVMEGTTGRTYITGPAGVLDYSAIMQNYQNFDTSNMAELQKQLENMQTQSSKTLPSVPFVVSFTEGKGEVLYTSFHNEAQNSEDVAKVLSWFAIRTQASSLAQSNRALATGNEQALLEIVDGINKNQTKTFKFEATGEAPFKIVLNFGGSAMVLTVKDPSGKEVSTKTVDQPPYTTEVTVPQKGKYSIIVEAKDIPSDNYPYVVTVLGAKNAAVEIQSAEATATTTDAGLIANLTSWVKDNILWLALGGIAFVVLLLIIIIIKLKKPHPGPPTKE